ncbi:hypothetical protein K456DRAFT_1805815, partial [Colletotrichum gloeosporioides 23]
LAGVNVPYWHIGRAGSGTCWHVEDVGLFSANLVCAGRKYWLFIPKSQREKFERLVQREFDEDIVCDQFIRHNSLMVTPKRLRAEGIQFHVAYCDPGQVIFTSEWAYHAVLNPVDCFATAINMALYDILPRGLCRRQC